MNTLILDTSTDRLFVMFYEEKTKEIIYAKQVLGHNNHSENLLCVIEEGLKETKLQLKDFEKIILGYGPGSYTGLRISMSVAKMASYTLNIPLYVISSLTLCGSGHLKENGIYAIRSKAKKSYSYLKIIDVTNKNINVLLEDIFLEDEEVLKMIEKYNAKEINEDNYTLDAEIIINLSSKVDNIHDIVPNYLRKANS